MDSRSSSKSINLCENSSDIVLEAVIVADNKGQTGATFSEKVLIEEYDLRTAKDGVSCSNISTHTVLEEVAGNVTDERCHEVKTDTSRKAKAKECHMVDLSGEGGESDGQRICRICHFGSDQSPDRVSRKTVNPELIEIGCKCKNELGLAHFHCAEAWFKLRGNR